MSATQHEFRITKLAGWLCAACCAVSWAHGQSDYRATQRAGSISMARRSGPEEIPTMAPDSNEPFASKPSLVDELAPPPLEVDHEVWAENPVDSRIPLDAPADSWSSGSWFMSGRRYAQVDALFAEVIRSKQDRVPLGVDSTNTNRILTANGRTFGIEAGTRITLGTFTQRDYLNRDHSVEATFFGINEFDVNAGIAGLGTNSIFTPINTNIPGFNGADTATSQLNARLYSIEANYKVKKRLEHDRIVMGPDGSWTRQFTKGYVPSLLFGLRHLSYEEDFLWQTRRNGVAPATFGGDYTIGTTNDLVGVQTGGELLDQYETWYWGFRGKAGAYINFSDLDRIVVINGNTVQDEHGSLNAGAFMGEFSTLIAYQLSPNWTIRASYDFYFLAGIAAHQQQINFNFDPVVGINNSALITIQSFSLGTEITW